MTAPYTITIGDLLDELAKYKRADLLYFGNGDLSLSRVKARGEMATIEFNQLYQIIADPDSEPQA